MASSMEDINYLSKSLKTKRPIGSIKERTAEEICKIFLDDAKSKSIRGEKLNALSDSLKDWSEFMKIKLILTIDHLSNKWLLKSESIKTLSADRIREIAWSKEEDKIQNIIDYLVGDGRKKGEELTIDQEKELHQVVMEWIEKHYWKMAEKEDISEELKTKNEELEEELKASEAANEVVEASVLTRRSLSNTIRVWKSIESINENKKWLDPATKARKVLWQANNFAVFGSGKRFDWVNKLPRKFDIKEEYNSVVGKLTTKMENTKNPKEKIAIRYIMRQVNKAYTDYIDAISIDEETRRWNMKTINMKMAA